MLLDHAVVTEGLRVGKEMIINRSSRLRLLWYVIGILDYKSITFKYIFPLGVFLSHSGVKKISTRCANM